MKEVLIIVAVVFGVTGMIQLDKYNEHQTYQLQTERHLKEWELKTRIEKAKAEQAKLRVKELEMLCSMVTPSGEVYLDKEC
jgi:uncharacterized membrane protein YsdA (DUF1294 family)